jgi:signal transduction histidine kinase
MTTTTVRIAKAPREPGVAVLGHLSLRGKGVVAAAALFAYLIVASLVVETQRLRIADALEELERVHGEEDRLARVNVSLAQAIVTTNERYYRTGAARDFSDVAVAADTVYDGMAGLAPRFPHLAPIAAGLATRTADLWVAREREALLDLRAALHEAVAAMDRATAQVRARRQELNALYRARFDQVSMVSFGLSIAGMLVFGALMLLFLTRLGWDLKRLQERALAVVKGYRGAPLPVTREDEIGALERSVNRMQQELVARETEVELARSQQFHREKMAAVGALASQVAHEINNPIAIIAGIAEAIGEGRIAEHARRVAGITRQIAQMSSPQPAERQLLDLNGLVENACAFASYDVRLRRVELELALDRRLPAVNAVGDHLTQVLMNLLINAADAIAETGVAGRIRVATQREPGAVLLTVSDNGAGMDEGVRSRAFEEFFTTKPQGKGCGIGLALSRRLLREAGADITLESHPGQGALVTVRLPA